MIDHSGAVYINGFATDDHNWTLGTGKLKEPVTKERGEREETTVICEGCFRTYAGSNICPTCGLVHKQKSSFIATIDAQLGLVDKVTREVKKKEKYGDGFKQRFYQELLGWTVVKKKKKEAAAYKYKERFNKWPDFGDVIPLQPSKETLSYIQHLNIKWARRKEMMRNNKIEDRVRRSYRDCSKGQKQWYAENAYHLFHLGLISKKEQRDIIDDIYYAPWYK